MTMLQRTASYTFAALFAALMFTAVPVFAQASSAQAKPAQKPAVDIMWMSKPPKTGENTFQVMVKDASGKPITDADVTAQFYIAAMPQMKMPEMKNTITLKHQKDGTYTGTGQVMMAGKWDVTVSVKRAGKQIGSKKFPVTAQ
jgi:nitrogen fixation protein FixH